MWNYLQMIYKCSSYDVLAASIVDDKVTSLSLTKQLSRRFDIAVCFRRSSGCRVISESHKLRYFIFFGKVRVFRLSFNLHLVFFFLVRHINLPPLWALIRFVSKFVTPIKLIDPRLGVGTFFCSLQLQDLLLMLTQGIWPLIVLAVDQSRGIRLNSVAF